MIEADTPLECAIGSIVVQRYRRAKEYREQHIVHQNMSFDALIKRADKQYRREYLPADAEGLQQAFGFRPTRYLGIVQQKVNAIVAWSNDLVINNLDSMFTAYPSPNPTIDDASRKRIRNGVKRELMARMQAAGLADPNLLLNLDGNLSDDVDDFVYEQVRALRKVEQARLVGLASEQAQLMQRRMRDTTIQGAYRQAYAAYTFERYLLGNSYIQCPDWQRRRVMEHTPKGDVRYVMKNVPMFRHVSTFNLYPVCDAPDMQTNTGNTEYSSISKVELINMANSDTKYGYKAGVIEEILTQFSYRSRNWLEGPMTDDVTPYWGLDESIELLRHEGFFSGQELADYGITGYDALEYVSARVEIVGGRAIRIQVKSLPGGFERTYFGAPFIKSGTGLLDCLGMGAMLWDSEQRVNVMMHLWENNADWAARPPLMKNSSAFKNPFDSAQIRPGEQYEVEDRFATSGTMPEPLRPMNTVSAQYHLLLSQVGAILRQADEDCGIPAFAYSAQDFGRSSLGEYSQRMSNALRTVKQAALNEDMYLTEPTFTGMFHSIMETDKELRVGQDVNMMVRGMTGLLKEDQQKIAQQAAIPSIIQLAQNQMVPQQAGEYAARLLMEQAGFPVDALGLSDPVMENALAVAASQPIASLAGGPQVPKLDGRSGVPSQNVAAPNGASQLSIPAPGGAVGL